ncbi:MAG TPA: MBL fold metallo-hydrolase [Aldersonia sp.]
MSNQSTAAPVLRSGSGWDRLVSSAVAPGVWATMLPFPSALSYSYSYLVRVPAGVIVVDLGWDSDDAWNAFQVGLSRAGATLDEVVGVVISHAHPDHYGFAAAIKEHTPAWIGAHPAERRQVAATAHERAARVEEMEHWMRRCGVPESHLQLLRREAAEIAATLPAVQPDIDLADGTPVPDSDGALLPIHTPGHTAGHLCFHDRGRDLLFTGDHLLPRVTPNVSKRPRSDVDPLSDFQMSLARVGAAARDTTLVLPGHEWAFDRADARVATILAHHADRLDEIEAAVTAESETVWEVASAVSWARPFDQLAPRAQRQAIGETHSHLFRLAREGRASAISGDLLRWRPSRSRSMLAEPSAAQRV